MLFLGGTLAFDVIENGPQPCDRIDRLGGWLDTRSWDDHFEPREIGLMFNPNVYPCHRVFHQLPERMLMTKRHSDGRGGERALESLLVDHVLDGVADSPALGIAGRVAAGPGWPGRTEILRVQFGMGIGHLGPLSGARIGCVHPINKV